MHLRATAGSPGALEAVKHLRLSPDERPLLLGRQLDHAPSLARTESGEDLAANSKVRMVHVRLLDGLGKIERHGAELICGHGCLQGESHELYDLASLE